MLKERESYGVRSTRNIWNLIRELARDPLSVILTIVIALSLLLFVIWFPIRNLIFLDLFSTSAKLRIMINAIYGLETNFSLFSRSLLITSALLSGITIAALILYLRKRTVLERTAGSSVLGIIIAVFGIGCASCGSVILTSLFGIGAISFTAALPFKGIEFSVLGVLLLLYSLVSIANKIQAPLVCSPKQRRNSILGL